MWTKLLKGLKYKSETIGDKTFYYVDIDGEIFAELKPLETGFVEITVYKNGIFIDSDEFWPPFDILVIVRNFFTN